MGELEELELHYTAVVGKQRGIHYDELPETPEPARSLRDLLPPNLVELRLKYDRSAMNANVGYTAELRELVQDDLNFPRKLKKVSVQYVHDGVQFKFPFSLHSLQAYFKAHGVDFHYIVKCEIDNEHELDYLVTTLATMGYEGAYMCKWFITDDNFWMTPEELYDRVMEEIRAAEKRHKVD
ncbi:hypothetical protein J4E86_005343 [Alternaria arbusti]|uniref:uncharacterized protein n=1 Tax=Alternaria arbusti TaxID=232088 RepID=UPI00221EBFAE|nr:uncharacterized protein J4E86_005343 [Alternaria arbusti]KAI4956871.1 hypothetical protein J4E86_005343 [Alternaria arbusti]